MTNEKGYTYSDVLLQPECLNSNSTTQYYYSTSDPTTGVSFPLWKSYNITLDSCNVTNATDCQTLCESNNGRYSSKDGTCLGYEVVDKICVEVNIVTSAD